jgi:hypothetical protein
LREEGPCRPEAGRYMFGLEIIFDGLESGLG